MCCMDATGTYRSMKCMQTLPLLNFSSALNMVMRGKLATEYSVICTHDCHMSEDSLKRLCESYTVVAHVCVEVVVRSPFVLSVFAIVCTTSDSPCDSPVLEQWFLIGFDEHSKFCFGLFSEPCF